MIQDKGPKQNLGFGLPLVEGEPNEDTESGISADSGAIAKYLGDKPLLKFASVAVASLVSMHVAGKVASHGGYHLAEQAANISKRKGWLADQTQNGLFQVRRAQKLLDEMQGVTREFVDPSDPTIFAKRHTETGKWIKEETVRVDGRAFRDTDDRLPPWLLRDEMQQRLVRQARRLPYEMPGFYLADKAIIDPLTGDNKDPKAKVKWTNPVDVMGDFAWETVKNVTTNVLPFELATGSGKNAVQRLLKTMSAPTGPTTASSGVLTSQAILEQLGVKAGDVINSTLKFSNQSMGAFSNAIEEASKQRRGMTDLSRSGSAIVRANPHGRQAGFARRNHEKSKLLYQDTGFRNQALDSMPGPFKGMRTGVQKFRQTFKEVGETYDDWQQLLQGHTTFDKLGLDRADRVRDYMRKGGGSHIEQVADQMQKLGIRSVDTSESVAAGATGGTLYNTVRQDQYKDTLVQKLTSVTGLSQEDAVKFVTHSSKIAAPHQKSENVGALLAQRFQIGKRASQATDDGEWWKEIQSHASGFRMGLDKVGLSDFQKAVNLADQSFLSRGQQVILDAKYKSYLNHVNDNLVPKHVGSSIAAQKADYHTLKNNLANNELYLVKNTAMKMGIKSVDETGAIRTTNELRNLVKKRGIDADDNTRMLGYLVDQKVVKGPSSLSGSKNLFGFSSVTMKEAMEGNFFAGHSTEVQQHIRNIAQTRAKGLAGLSGDPSIIDQALSSMKLKGVYRSASGQIVDVGRIRRGVTKTFDALATETKIPVLGFNPAQLGFYNSRMSAREAAPIQFASKYSLQNVKQRTGNLGGDKNADLYMYIRNEGKSKGKLFGLKGAIFDTEATSKQFAGEYRPFISNRLSMTGRYSELYLGQSSVPGSETQSGWRKLFNVSTHQENQIVGGKESLSARLRSVITKSPEADRNPRRLARKLGSGTLTPADVRKSGILSESTDAMYDQMKAFGASEKMINQYIRQGIIGSSSPVSILNAPEASMAAEVRSILTSDIESHLSDTAKAALSRAQEPIKRLLNQGDNQTSFWGLPAPSNIKTIGVSRRLDQLRSEFSEYLVLRSDHLGDTAGMPFSSKVSMMFSEIDSMFSKGQLSKIERAEARTSVLSLQLQHSRNDLYDATKGKWRPQLNQEVLERSINDPVIGKDIKNALKEYGSYSTEGVTPFGSPKLKSLAKIGLAPGEYRGPATIDAVGAPYTFVPTIATGFMASPLKTVKGLMGGTWSDPDAITSGSLFSTHMAARVNGYFESIGLGLDLTKYKGPADFYVKGVIGKRVLPAYAAGTIGLEIDRTLGGLTQKDDEGNRVYSPLVVGAAATGVAHAQVALAGLVPGGQTAAEKKEEIFEGEVPVRQGRYWLLNSNTPFKGGRIQYFRPSWYQRLKAGGEYTPEMKQTPLERLAFGYDFSPLRPLDPYRFERENKESRPYPVSGQYFSGPFGPLTSALNATIGRVLKPTQAMHVPETTAALASYTPVGQAGAISINDVTNNLTGINAGYSSLAGSPGSSSVGPFYGANGFTNPRGLASATTVGTSNSVASMYQGMASGANYPGVYAPIVAGGLGGVDRYGAQVVPSNGVVQGSANKQRAGRFGFEAQEMAGIYGFGFGAGRQALGLGRQDYTPGSAVLESADKGYSASRSFWGLNIGGLGDMPLPLEGRGANLEFSEVIRRFVPQEQQGIQYINGIPNEIGKLYPWLPGAGSMNNLKQGDPYGRLPDASIRLPGTGRDRTTQRFPDMPGQRYGLTDIHDILGDLDPYGDGYRQLDRSIESMATSPLQQAKIRQTRAQVEAMGIGSEFTPYKYKDTSIAENIAALEDSPVKYSLNRGFEYLAHRDTFLNSKFLRTRTALEDWERDHVYGATYPSWTSPVDSFIQPIINRSTQRDPISAATGTAFIGSLFGDSARARAMGGVIGGATGLGASMYGNAYEKITGNRFIPKSRKKELLLEEQTDILSYVHSMTNASRASQAGDTETASYFLKESAKTMYGANLNGTPEQLAQAVPKRKREHFEAMLFAPQSDRADILSTAGRLERRLLQAAWGQRVEKLPDLATYFEERELPAPESSFWSPYTDMESIKIKMGQHMGVDMSQMGYYPQQLQEASLINPAYPQVFQRESGSSVRSKLMSLLGNLGVNGTVDQRPTPFGGDSFELMAGN